MPTPTQSSNKRHNMKLKSLMLFMLVVANASYASETYVCPTHMDISSGSVQLKSMPEGFESLVPQTTVWLNGVNIFDGHPKQRATLIETSTSDHGNISTWKFEGNFPDGKWFSCDYQQGFVSLVKKIDDSAKSCTTKNRWINRAQKELEVTLTCQ
jgi:hypothetical protein